MLAMSDLALVLALALTLEVAFGDPVTRWHPVAIFGAFMNRFMAFAPAEGPVRQLAFGTAVVALGVGLVAAGSATALQWIAGSSGIAAMILGGVLLKVSLSYRQLEREAVEVADLIETERLTEARLALRALVARETGGLAPSLAASAAVESVAENLSDSFVAPLFYCVLLGVPGALAYRAVNTLDAMIGYHGRFEYLGRVAAKMDDVVNFIPARLTAGLIVLAAALAGSDARGAAAVALRDHRRTASPNAGWPMSAMAGAVHARIEKVGHYRLGAADGDCTPLTIRDAVRVARWGAVLAAGFAVAAALGASGSGSLWSGLLS